MPLPGIRVRPPNVGSALAPSQRPPSGADRGRVAVSRKTSVQSWLKIVGARPEAYVFPSRVNRERHLSTPQYARLVDEWVGFIGLDPSAYGTHSLRRTKAALIYKRTGNLRAVQLLLGHSKLESTVRYLEGPERPPGGQRSPRQGNSAPVARTRERNGKAIITERLTQVPGRVLDRRAALLL